MVFLDESGFSLSLHRFYGWAARGKRLTEAVPYGRGKNLSLLGALSRAGMLCTRYKEGAMDRKDVEAFLENDLLPRLSAGSVLVLIHKYVDTTMPPSIAAATSRNWQTRQDVRSSTYRPTPPTSTPSRWRGRG